MEWVKECSKNRMSIADAAQRIPQVAACILLLLKMG